MRIEPATRLTVQDLLYWYADAADRLDAVDVARVLGDADVTFGGDRVQGAVAVEEVFHGRFRSAPPARHLVTNVTIDCHDADSVLTVRATYLRVGRANPLEILSVGQYIATAEESDDRILRFLTFEVRTEGLRTAPPSPP